MAGGTCSARFTINLSFVRQCSLQLYGETDPVDVPSKTPDGTGTKTPINKSFNYVMGINPNPSRGSYGFKWRAINLPAGVSVQDVVFGHNRPKYQGANAVGENSFSANVVVDDMYNNANDQAFNIIIEMNTGV